MTTTPLELSPSTAAYHCVLAERHLADATHALTHTPPDLDAYLRHRGDAELRLAEVKTHGARMVIDHLQACTNPDIGRQLNLAREVDAWSCLLDAPERAFPAPRP